MDPYRSYEAPAKENMLKAILNLAYKPFSFFVKIAFVVFGIAVIVSLLPLIILVAMSLLFGSWNYFGWQLLANTLIFNITILPTYKRFWPELVSIKEILILWIRGENIPVTLNGKIDWFYFLQKKE